MRKHTHRLLAIVFLLTGLLAQAQSEAEKTLLKSATKQFEAGEFLAAMPAYSQLLSIAPDNKDYNFKFGTCLLASDEDVDRALKHLKYVSTDDSFEDKRAYFYLAKAYHLNYQFADALRTYERFKNSADTKTLKQFSEVDRLISMAENGKALMTDIKDIRVIDKTESTAGDFFRNYDMSEMGGSVIKVPEDLLSSVDKKQGHSPVMFFPEGGGEIIFSSYGSGDHLDLYSVQRTADGGFSKPKKLAGVVNSPFDEDFPFLHSDGSTLYFSSKGHSSMGGYDIFKSRRNLSTGLFESPVNLDFAISSPDDDIFYIVDRDKRIANFASDRSSESGRLHVYKVAVSNANLEMAIIQGKLVNTASDNNIARIRVLDANTDEEIGVYLTDEEGNYLIDLPGMGKYKFFVEGEESQVLHTGLVDVPSFGEIKAFRQEMILSVEAAQEKLVIKNQFDEEADVDILALIQDVVKQKSQLDVNFDGEVLAEEEAVETEAEEVLTESQLVSRAGYGEEVSIASLLEKGVNQKQQLADKLAAEKIERDKAYARTIEWTERSEVQMSEAEELFQASQNSASSDQKEALLLQTSLKRAEAEEANEKAAIALLLAKEVDKVIVEKTSVMNSLDQRNQDLSAAIDAGEQSTIVAKLEEIKSYEDKAIIQADALDAINKRSIDTNRDAAKIVGRVEDIRIERRAAKEAIATKETQLAKTKKQKEKNILEAELTSLKAEVADMDVQLERSSTRMQTAQLKADESTGAVQLLEQMRVGQMPELVALQPLEIPEGGLSDSERRLGAVRSIAEGIDISTEDLDRILKTRPELLTTFSADDKAKLMAISDAGLEENNLATANTVEDAEAISDASLEEIDALNTDSEEPEVDNTVDPQEVSDTINEGSSIDSDTAAAETAELEETGQPDYRALSTDDLLDQLQLDYQSARDDIDASDMLGIEKSKAKIDLNRAAIQVINQEVSELEFSDDFASNELKQSNAATLRELSKELEYEMLEIAYQSETPIYPDPLAPTTDELAAGDTRESEGEDSRTADAADDIDVSDANVSESNDATDGLETMDSIDPSVLQEINEPALVTLLNLDTEVDALEASIDEISNDRGRSDIVQTASRIKARGDFIDGVKETIPEREIDSEGEQQAMEMLIARQQEKMVDDIKIWQVQSGSTLELAEQVMAKNNAEYITRRTILEGSDDQAAIGALNIETSQLVLDDTDGLALLGVNLLTEVERQALLALIPAADLAETEISVDEDGLTDGSYELVYFKLATIAEDKTWIPNLIKDKDVRQRVMDIQEQMSLLPIYGSSDAEKIEEHIKLNNDLAAEIARELQAKEEDFLKVSDGKEVPAEVTDLMAEVKSMSARADEIRAFAKINPDQFLNAEMLTKASQLELKAMDKFEKAKELQVHLSKGRDRTAFAYDEAIEIDTNMLMNESAAYAEAGAESSELAASDIEDASEGAEGSYDLLYFKLATIAEDKTWIPNLVKDKGVRQRVMDIQEQMSLLPIYGSNDADKIEEHIKLNNDLAAEIAREMLAKEEDFLKVSDGKEQPAEVTDLMAEVKTMSARADQIRAFAQINPDQLINAEMLTKASQLELKAMDKFEKAKELQVHLSKGRDRTAFAYDEAIEIDTDLLMNESAAYAEAGVESSELATTDNEESSAGEAGIYDLVYFKLSTIAEDKTWVPSLIKDKDVRKNVMRIREQMALLPEYGQTDDDKIEEHINLNNELAVHLEREMLMKETEFRRVSRRKQVPAEVTDLLEEAYALTTRADEIRDYAKVNPDQVLNAEMLTRATQLELKSMEKLEMAKELQVHVSKGQSQDSFVYQEAIVIDTGLLMNETAEYLDPESDLYDSSIDSTQDVAIDDSTLDEAAAVAEESVATELESGQDNTDTDESLSMTEAEDVKSADLSLTLEQQRLAAEDVVTDIAQIDELKKIEPTEAMRDFPELTAELNEEEIAPILSFEELTSLSAEEAAEVDNTEDWNMEGADPDQLAALERKGAAVGKQERYQASLNESIAGYSDARQKRMLRLAEVIDEIATEGNSPDRDKEAQQLTKEIQIIDGYSRQAELNLANNQMKLQALAEEREEIVQEIESTIEERDALTSAQEIAADQEENLVPDVAEEEANNDATTEVLETDVSEKSIEELLQEVADEEQTRQEEPSVVIFAVDNPTSNAEESSSADENTQEESIEPVAATEATNNSVATPENPSNTGEQPANLTASEALANEEPIIAAGNPESPAALASNPAAYNTPPVAPDYEDFTMPDVLVYDYYKVSPANPERSRRITIDGDMPDGTVYQVQVGAFRFPIPEAHFSEFDPIMGTRLDNGITRYKVGLFQTESTAITARNQIRALGYSDAFVVKYVDGSRDGIISGDAIAALSSDNSNSNQSASNPTTSSDNAQSVQTNTAANSDGSTVLNTDSGTQISNSDTDVQNADSAINPSSDTQSATNTIDSQTTATPTESESTADNSARDSQVTIPAINPTASSNPSTDGARSARPLREYDSDNTAYYDEAIDAAPATQVERIEGMFYTVQVGVYSKPVTLASLFNINPLNSDLTPTGYIRYTSGIFDDAVVAEQWKKKLQARGIQDAFVTAYYNGNRITMSKSREILSAQGRGVLVAVDELNTLDSDRQGQAVWEMVSTSDLFSDEVADKIDFKIRMGPYYERIPDSDVKVILDFEENVDYNKLDDGAIVYTTKGRMTYEMAQEWRTKFLQLGITNANIIALKEGKEIPVKQALDFLLK